MSKAIIFDWGDTVMRNFTEYPGPMANWPRVEAMPGIEYALQALHPHHRLVMATNAADSGRDLVVAALRRVALDGHFDAVYTARELGARKPEPAFYQAMLQALGCPPHEATMVGDDYRADVCGAKQAGLRAIWYNPAASPCPDVHPLHDAEVQALASLPATLSGPRLPDVAECLQLLAGQEVPPNVITHCRAVAAVAHDLACRLRSRGHAVDPLLAHRGGLLHDLDKASSRLAAGGPAPRPPPAPPARARAPPRPPGGAPAPRRRPARSGRDRRAPSHVLDPEPCRTARDLGAEARLLRRQGRRAERDQPARAPGEPLPEIPGERGAHARVPARHLAARS